jgi:hypothetical protein
LRSYLEQKRSDKDWGTLFRLCHEFKTKQQLPNPNAELLVHLRSGDTNRYDPHHVMRCVNERVETIGRSPNYVAGKHTYKIQASH